MKTRKYNSFNELEQIVDFTHDQKFDIEDVKFENNTISIKFCKVRTDNKNVINNYFLFKKITQPIEECYLNIHNVKDYKLDDKEKIGVYEFNSWVYLEEEGKLIVTTTIPTNFEIYISKFEIETVETGKVLTNKTRIKIF